MLFISRQSYQSNQSHKKEDKRAWATAQSAFIKASKLAYTTQHTTCILSIQEIKN